MADTVNIPGLGKTNKTTAYMLGGGAVLVVGVAWYRARNAPAAAAPAAAAADGEGINPATGYTYGSDGDLAALGQAGQYGTGYYGASGGGANYNPTPPATAAFTTNAQWAQAAEDYLVNTVGHEANTTGNALGKYITGQAMTTDQASLVQQAIAFAGYPPVNGPTGYPPSYKTSTEPPPSTPPAATKPGAVTGLKTTRVEANRVSLDWTPTPGAQGYHVFLDGHQITSVVYSLYTVSGLARNKSHRYGVQAFNQVGAGPTASITVKTKAK